MLSLMTGCSNAPNIVPSPTSENSENCTPEPRTDIKNIDREKLPGPIANVLNNNSVFAGLKMVKATKISDKNKVFYNLAFEDEEKFIIRAKFNKKGQLIPYDSQPIEVAQP
ncbi:hypothetical protein DN752_06410 [Echinicola strongylocentroti]|uniref:Uncharacterized protein n=2 Tax=Echinicola strongylocentroti TaxID=1795355 RepID=A0A2Z4IGE9_9BACT|nr:hypothetical protein DN752_06410 [Echinicola strongylocentroti]